MSLLLGGIVMWSGLLTDIPENFALCDGQNGTLDLRNKFIIGAGDLYDVEDTGGFADATLVTHNHAATTSTSTNHTHNYSASRNATNPTGLFDFNGAENTSLSTNAGGAHSHTVTVPNAGESEVDKNLPPYFALAFIQQIS